MSPLDVSSSPHQRWLAKEFANSFEQNHRSIPHEVHAYAEFARHLSETEGPEPDPAFRAALRHRLLHELIEDELVPESDQLAQRRQERARRKGGTHCFERAPREPWIAAASTVLMVCGGAFGLGHESSQAAPGDLLYPVKQMFESGEMALASSPDGQARELMEQAGERLGEARQLVKTDEIHAQQALPETIVDFSEATAEAGDIVIEQSRTPSGDLTLVSEFHSFSSAARVLLDEIAASADQTTVALIDDARSTLDRVDQRLPIADPVPDGVDDLPVTSDALNILGLGADEHADDLNESPLDPVEFGPEVQDTVSHAATTLRNTVSVVELSASDKVSMAVATVHRTVDTAQHTVARTTAAVSDTIDRTVETVRVSDRQDDAPSVKDVAADLSDGLLSGQPSS